MIECRAGRRKPFLQGKTQDGFVDGWQHRRQPPSRGMDAGRLMWHAVRAQAEDGSTPQKACAHWIGRPAGRYACLVARNYNAGTTAGREATGDRMTGTLINIAAVLCGGTLGLIFGARVPERLKATVVAGLGLFVAAIGVQMFLKTGKRHHCSGLALDRRAARRMVADRGWPPIPGTRCWNGDSVAVNSEAASSRFVKGFLTTSLLFCVGPLTILGSIQDGLTGDYSLLAVKSVLDGFAALAFASTLRAWEYCSRRS